MILNRHQKTVVLAAVSVLLALAVRVSAGEGEVTLEQASRQLHTVIQKHCIACHKGDSDENDLNLELALKDLSNGDQVELWSNVIKMVQFGEMPPEDEDQPETSEKETLLRAADAVLMSLGEDSLLEAIGTDPTLANYVNHEELFSGKHAGPAFTPSRLWYKQAEQASSGTVNGPTLDNLLTFFNVRIAEQVDGVMVQGKLSSVDSQKMNDRADRVKEINMIEDLAKRQAELAKLPEKIEPPYVLAKYDQVYHAFATAAGEPNDDECAEILRRAFIDVLKRPPQGEELAKYTTLLKDKSAKIGRSHGLKVVLLAIHLKPEVFYRLELGMGEPLADGRRRLAPMETYYALCHAMGVTPVADVGEKPRIRAKDGTLPPLNEVLLLAAYEQRLNTPEGIRETLQPYLASDRKEGTNVGGYYYGEQSEMIGPRGKMLDFIKGYFGYAEAEDNFKDNKPNRPDYLVKDADYFVHHVLNADKDVLKELLTADTYPFPYNKQFGIVCNTRSWFKEHRGHYGLDLKPLLAGELNSRIVEEMWTDERGRERTKQEIHITFEDRAGLLTHPVWNFAHSKNNETDPVVRGKWIREKLLAGTIRDVPIQVDAKVSDDHSLTLRERFDVTKQAYCWSCHQKMNPLGMPFESYDELGQYRTLDKLANKPIDSSGYIDGTGEEGVDGKVTSAVELAQRLAKSTRVRQSFVRHAFRFWIGRNEMLSDSPTLMAADKAYVESGGSMQSLVLTLVTSDSFLYRK